MTEVEQAVMTLAKKRAELALMTDIQDMGEYIEAWRKLSEQFTALGYKHNASICKSNADRYAREHPQTRKDVVVQVDETTIRFENADDMAGWMADVMNQESE